FGSPETEDIQTLLLAGTHRWTTVEDGFVEVGAYWRRNDDNYAFNRFSPVPAIPPFKHTTHVTAAGGRGRFPLDDENAIEVRLWAIADEIESTSLRFGRFYSRTHLTGGAYYDHRSDLAGGGQFTLLSGIGYDTTNRGDDAITPVIELGFDLLGFIFYELGGGTGIGGIGHSAHLGGFGAGWIFFRYVHQQGSASFGSGSPSIELPAWLKRSKRKPAEASSYKVNVGASSSSSSSSAGRHFDLRAEVDRILDKINNEGFGALTDEEKRILDRAKDSLNKS
ncbi:hypothetical protein N9K67_05385, partial [Opitutaceae bacterium]|nr:hypothetical protein [Opitutaceae bacterium]